MQSKKEDNLYLPLSEQLTRINNVYFATYPRLRGDGFQNVNSFFVIRAWKN